jgi:hypothetical protein
MATFVCPREDADLLRLMEDMKTKWMLTAITQEATREEQRGTSSVLLCMLPARVVYASTAAPTRATPPPLSVVSLRIIEPGLVMAYSNLTMSSSPQPFVVETGATLFSPPYLASAMQNEGALPFVYSGYLRNFVERDTETVWSLKHSKLCLSGSSQDEPPHRSSESALNAYISRCQSNR